MVVLLLISLLVSSEEHQTEDLEFYYGEQSYLVDRDFFDDLDYSKDQ